MRVRGEGEGEGSLPLWSPSRSSPPWRTAPSEEASFWKKTTSSTLRRASSITWEGVRVGVRVTLGVRVGVREEDQTEDVEMGVAHHR